MSLKRKRTDDCENVTDSDDDSENCSQSTPLSIVNKRELEKTIEKFFNEGNEEVLDIYMSDKYGYLKVPKVLGDDLKKDGIYNSSLEAVHANFIRVLSIYDLNLISIQFLGRKVTLKWILDEMSRNFNTQNPKLLQLFWLFFISFEVTIFHYANKFSENCPHRLNMYADIVIMSYIVLSRKNLMSKNRNQRNGGKFRKSDAPQTVNEYFTTLQRGYLATTNAFWDNLADNLNSEHYSLDLKTWLKIALSRGKWDFHNGMTFNYGIFPSSAKLKGYPCCFYFTNQELRNDLSMLKNVHFPTCINITDKTTLETQKFRLSLYEDILLCKTCKQYSICKPCATECPKCSENTHFSKLENCNRRLHIILGIIIADVIAFSFTNIVDEINASSLDNFDLTGFGNLPDLDKTLNELLEKEI